MQPLTIDKHMLIGTDGQPVSYEESPNHGGKLVARFLVMHYTAGANFRSSVEWLSNAKARASAHLVIGRAGDVVQLVPFNVMAWHAGESAWTDHKTGQRYVGLNTCSIGIELDNQGPMELDPATGLWRSSVNKLHKPEEVIVAKHKHGGVAKGWQKYTEVQLQLALEIGKLIAKTYGITDVMGHEDVCPNRKQDPGPAFPLADFRSDVLESALEPQV